MGSGLSWDASLGAERAAAGQWGNGISSAASSEAKVFVLMMMSVCCGGVRGQSIRCQACATGTDSPRELPEDRRLKNPGTVSGHVG